MRSCFTAVLATLLLFSFSARAGTITLTDGKTTWQSLWCIAPTPPPFLKDADRNSSAEDMNVRMSKYNEYVNLTQIYMDCVSNEAQHDANMASEEIIKSGAAAIESAKANMEKLGAPLMAKE